jgi:hypothetical protein
MKSHTKPPEYAATRRSGQAGPRLPGTLPTFGLQPISSPVGADHSCESADAILGALVTRLAGIPRTLPALNNASSRGEARTLPALAEDSTRTPPPIDSLDINYLTELSQGLYRHTLDTIPQIILSCSFCR